MEELHKPWRQMLWEAPSPTRVMLPFLGLHSAIGEMSPLSPGLEWGQRLNLHSSFHRDLVRVGGCWWIHHQSVTGEGGSAGALTLKQDARTVVLTAHPTSGYVCGSAWCLQLRQPPCDHGERQEVAQRWKEGRAERRNHFPPTCLKPLT